MQASVIVPAYNAAGSIRGCLQALQAQTLARDQYEIIVVDDGSTDATSDIALSMGVEVLRQPRGGPAVARNLGASRARSPLLVFTDADCVPAADWLWMMVRHLARPEVVGAKGVYRTHQGELAARFVQLEYEEKYQRLAAHEYIDMVDTHAAAYRRDIFLEHGGFDARFLAPAAEDTELSFRLAEKGYKLVFAGDAVVYHHHVNTWQAYARRKFRLAYWEVLNRWKHPRKLISSSYTPQSQRAQLVLTAAMLALMPVALLHSVWWGVQLLLVLSFALSAVPLVEITSGRDPEVLPILPWMLVLRAVSVMAGLAVGMVHFPLLWLLQHDEQEDHDTIAPADADRSRR